MKTMLATLTLVSLAACDGGGVIDQTIQHGVRQSAVEACMTWIPQSDIALAAGLDGDRLCSCAVDRLLADKNVSDLPELRPGSAETRAAIVQCVGEIQASRRGAQ